MIFFCGTQMHTNAFFFWLLLHAVTEVQCCFVLHWPLLCPLCATEKRNILTINYTSSKFTLYINFGPLFSVLRLPLGVSIQLISPVHSHQHLLKDSPTLMVFMWPRWSSSPIYPTYSHSLHTPDFERQIAWTKSHVYYTLSGPLFMNLRLQIWLKVLICLLICCCGCVRITVCTLRSERRSSRGPR